MRELSQGVGFFLALMIWANTSVAEESLDPALLEFLGASSRVEELGIDVDALIEDRERLQGRNVELQEGEVSIGRVTPVLPESDG